MGSNEDGCYASLRRLAIHFFHSIRESNRMDRIDADAQDLRRSQFGMPFCTPLQTKEKET
jgi:hypothetical protein